MVRETGFTGSIVYKNVFEFFLISSIVTLIFIIHALRLRFNDLIMLIEATD